MILSVAILPTRLQVVSPRLQLKPTVLSHLHTLLGHATHPLDAFVISPKFFRPHSDKVGDETSFNKSMIQDVRFSTSDGRNLHGYYVPAEQKTDNVTLLCHGRSGDVNYWCPSMLSFQKALESKGAHTNLFLFDYRGYGESSGRRPTRLTAPKDAYAAWCYLRACGFKPEDIHIAGHSSGAAVAQKLTTWISHYRNEKPASLILASSYLSPRAATIATKPEISGLKLWLVGSVILNPEKMITEIDPNIPVTFIHGTNDEYFSPDHSCKLFELSGANSKAIFKVPAEHLDVFNHLNDASLSRLSGLFNQHR